MTCTNSHKFSVEVCMHVYLNVCVCMCIKRHALTHTSSVLRYSCIHACMCICMDVYKHTHTHTYIYIYVRTQGTKARLAELLQQLLLQLDSVLTNHHKEIFDEWMYEGTCTFTVGDTERLPQYGFDKVCSCVHVCVCVDVRRHM